MSKNIDLSQCPCGSQQSYKTCCEPFHRNSKNPETAEALMRARYSAFVLGEIRFLSETLAPESRSDYDEKSTKEWSTSVQWKGLKVLRTEKGSPTDDKGIVEFVATYQKDGVGLDHHEVSSFRKTDKGIWYFVEGDGHTHKEGESHDHTPIETYRRESPKLGRNDPCTCGSGKKYKKCCGA
jgi:SEC-C motif-containing protein